MQSSGTHLALFFLLGFLSPTLAMATDVTVKAAVIDPAIGGMDTASLINRLQFETQSVVPLRDATGKETGFAVEAPALARGFPFLPLDVQPDWERFLRRQATSPIMTELVRRGVAALPQLLQRLDDPRPTLLVARGPHIGIVAFGNRYDARQRDPAHQPAGVNTGEEHSLAPNDAYVYTVGDLCYLTALKIVNRHAGGGRAVNTSIISSPAKYPALAAAMRADWAGLTTQEHETGLRAEALELNPDGSRGNRSSGAVQRLLFYYPDAGREIAEALLRRARDDPSAKSAPARWLGETYHLMDDLAAFEWAGLDDLVFAVFERATRLPDFNGELTVICARRLAGRGRDAQLRECLRALIAGNEAVVEHASSDKVERRVRSEANDSYRGLLQTLAAK
jgi:hypothetical protein